jgi:hypothetical protein
MTASALMVGEMGIAMWRRRRCHGRYLRRIVTWRRRWPERHGCHRCGHGVVFIWRSRSQAYSSIHSSRSQAYIRWIVVFIWRSRLRDSVTLHMPKPQSLEAASLMLSCQQRPSLGSSVHPSIHHPSVTAGSHHGSAQRSKGWSKVVIAAAVVARQSMPVITDPHSAGDDCILAGGLTWGLQRASNTRCGQRRPVRYTSPTTATSATTATPHAYDATCGEHHPVRGGGGGGGVGGGGGLHDGRGGLEVGGGGLEKEGPDGPVAPWREEACERDRRRSC